MLDAQSGLRLADTHRRGRLHGRHSLALVVPVQHSDDAHQQLHQPTHLRRQVPRVSSRQNQVPRVPDGSQTHAAQTGRTVRSASARDARR